MIALVTNKTLAPLSAINNFLEFILKKIVVLCMAILVLDVIWGVFTRFILNEQSPWTEELARFLLVWVAMLGAAVAFREKSHLGVDAFVAKLDPQAQTLAAVMIDVLTLLFALGIFVVGGGTLVMTTNELGQLLVALPVSKAVFYISLPISGCLIAVFSLEALCKNLLQMCTCEE